MNYTLIKEIIYNDVVGSYESFGIENENGYKISDISTNPQDVQKLLSTINSKQTPENYVHDEIERLFSEL